MWHYNYPPECYSDELQHAKSKGNANSEGSLPKLNWDPVEAYRKRKQINLENKYDELAKKNKAEVAAKKANLTKAEWDKWEAKVNSILPKFSNFSSYVSKLQSLEKSAKLRRDAIPRFTPTYTQKDAELSKNRKDKIQAYNTAVDKYNSFVSSYNSVRSEVYQKLVDLINERDTLKASWKSNPDIDGETLSTRMVTYWNSKISPIASVIRDSKKAIVMQREA